MMVLVTRKFLVSSWSLWEPQEDKIIYGVKLAITEMETSILSRDLLLCGARELNP